ncbi:MAG: stage II sporulation protein P [Oscillospiraceae bacterium]|nr:stage II sporulation protein P [Oscillospiraceae bacterium]
MSRKKKDRLRTVAAVSVFILLLPLMIAAAAASVPEPEQTVFFAAASSAFLSAGDIFPHDAFADKSASDKHVTDTSVTELSASDKSAAEMSGAVMVFSVDDSEMLSYGVPDIPNSTDEERYVPDKKYDVGPEPYPESLENHDGIITAISYGHFNGDNYIDLDTAGQVRNITSISNKTLLAESRLSPDFEIEKNGEPQILIMHTHTTESYEPYERDFYDAGFTSRTTDESMNMVAVGDAIAEQLEAAGIGVIHDTTKHDYPSYNDSYDRSRVTVQNILEEYPSIKIVLDIHRDAMERSDGERLAPTAEIKGRSAAQVMIISGCDDGTMDMPDYLKNFRFACLLQQQMEKDFPGLTRPVLFDYRKYNQDLTTGSVLIEVGGHANSIDQAIYSGELIGRALAECFT